MLLLLFRHVIVGVAINRCRKARKLFSKEHSNLQWGKMNSDTKYPAGIRQVNASDIDAISEIEKRCFEGPIAYSKRQLAYLALDANSTCLIESHNNTIRGFIIVGYRKGSLTGRIETIDVDPRFQNKGVGIKLLMAAEDDMKRRGMKTAQLEVSERNERALELYRKAGYTFKEKLEGYYLYDHDKTRNAIRMVKSL
jgi:ribosomal protein S18 acetylase RimI-like enzyme